MPFSQSDPHAYMGFNAQIIVNAIQMNSAASSLALPLTFGLRATSFGVQVKQDITFPDLIDGIVDKSAYQLGIKQVEGDIALPLMHEGAVAVSSVPVQPTPPQYGGSSGWNEATANGGYPAEKGSGCGSDISTSLASVLWLLATQRDMYGRMANGMDIGAVYPDNSVFVYPSCLVNNLGFKVVQGGPVDVTFGVVGGANACKQARIETTTANCSAGEDDEDDYAAIAAIVGNPNFLAPSRIITWNDFSLAIFSQETPVILDGSGIREFNVDVKNNIERYPTLNGALVPQDIAAKKREISGTIKLLGRNNWLNYWGYNNETRFTSDESLAFGYKIGSTLATSTFYWTTAMHGLIFKIEEMTISPNEVFETTVGFQALGDCSVQANYEATEKGTDAPSNATNGVFTNPQLSEGDPSYGGPTKQASTLVPSDAVGTSMPNPFGGWDDSGAGNDPIDPS